MKSSITYFFLLIVMSVLSFAKANAQPTINWQKAFGGNYGASLGEIKPTSDGGYILLASTSSTNGDVSVPLKGGSDIWIAKLTASGSISWQKNYGGSANEWANSISQTSDGGYVFMASTVSTDGDITTNKGGRDVWIVKLNDTGKIQWQKTYGGTADDGSFGTIGTMAYQTSDGGYVMLSPSKSSDGDVPSNKGMTDYWVARLNSSGSIIWSKTYGGGDEDIPSYLKPINSGGYIVAGKTKSNNGDVSGNKGLEDGWVLSIDDTGKLKWQKSYGGTKNDVLYMICSTSTNELIAAGTTYSNDGGIQNYHDSSDVWVIKIDSLGGEIWSKAYGGSRQDGANAIIQDLFGNLTVAGNSNSSDGDINTNVGLYDVWMFSINTNGDLRWKKSYGGSKVETVSRIYSTSDGGYVTSGITNSTDGDALNSNFHGGSGFDVWVIKFSSPLRVGYLNDAGIKVYPTLLSVSENINVSIKSASTRDISFQLTDMSGRVIDLTRNHSLDKVVLSSNTGSGVYILKIILDREVFYYKIQYR